MTYKIADILYEIEAATDYIPDSFEPFHTQESISCSCSMDTKLSAGEFVSPGGLVFRESCLEIYHNSDTTEVVIRNTSGTVFSSMSASPDWRNINIEMPELRASAIKTLSEIAFRVNMIFNSGIVIHGAAVDWNDKGIIFSAPSGTGKTTQAKLWEKNMGAEIINGDRPAIRCVMGKCYLYGTPWSGSSDNYINRKTKLNTIVVLNQYKENRIHKLSQAEALSTLVPRCFFPYWDKTLMNMALSNLEKIINTTPVYLLECLPDTGAVELLYDCLKK